MDAVQQVTNNAATRVDELSRDRFFGRNSEGKPDMRQRK
jgi:hypothetical protein